MNKIINALKSKNRHDLVAQVKKLKIIGVAGNYYKKLDIKDGSEILVTYLTRSYDAGAKLIAIKSKGKYHIISFKRNKNISSLHLKYTFTKYGIEKGLKKLEEEAKEENIFQYSKTLSPKDFIKQLLIKESLSKLTFDLSFPELDNVMQDDGDTTHKIGNFDVIYESSLKESTKKVINDFIIAASDIVKKFGLEKLLYGKVIIVDKLPGKAVADYSERNDLIRLQKKAKKNKDSILSFIHELGHRLLDKGFIKDRVDVVKKFDQDVANTRRDIKSGDVFEDKDGRDITIETLKFTGRRLLYIITIEGKEGQYQVPEDYFISLNKIKGKEDKPPEWIPTGYSKTSYSEWLSEIFAYGLVDNNKLYKDYIKSIVK